MNKIKMLEDDLVNQNQEYLSLIRILWSFLRIRSCFWWYLFVSIVCEVHEMLNVRLQHDRDPRKYKYVI